MLHYGNHPKFIPAFGANGASLWELPQVYTCIQSKWCFTMGITPSLYLYPGQMVLHYGNYPKFIPVSRANGASLWELPQVCTCIWRQMVLHYGNRPKFVPFSGVNGASLWELPQVYTCIWRQMVLLYGNYPKFIPVSGGKCRFTMGITPSLYLHLAESGASLWELPQVCTCIWR